MSVKNIVQSSPRNCSWICREQKPRQGTVEENGNLIALLTGVVSESDGVVSVRTYNEMLCVQVKDTVIGEVVNQTKSLEPKILSVEGKPNRSVMADQEYAQSTSQNHRQIPSQHSRWTAPQRCRACQGH